MAEPEQDFKRLLQIKMRALGDPKQVLALIRGAAPFYRTLGGTGFRVLQNVDDPAQLLIEIEYAAHAALEQNDGSAAPAQMQRRRAAGGAPTDDRDVRDDAFSHWSPRPSGWA